MLVALCLSREAARYRRRGAVPTGTPGGLGEVPLPSPRWRSGSEDGRNQRDALTCALPRAKAQAASVPCCVPKPENAPEASNAKPLKAFSFVIGRHCLLY